MKNVLAGIAVTVLVAIVAYFALELTQQSAAERFTVPGVRIDG